MRGTPRRWFAAPLVAITGCASSTSTPRDDTHAYVSRDDTACSYTAPSSPCPKNARCNPPPPQGIECPPGMGSASDARVVRHGDGCVLLVEPCKTPACGTPTTCVVSGFEPLKTLRWVITPADAKCTATPAARGQWSGGPPPFTIDCPPALADKRGVIERADPSAACRACAATPCDASATLVPCPDRTP